jgi:hypothetical protein
LSELKLNIQLFSRDLKSQLIQALNNPPMIQKTVEELKQSLLVEKELAEEYSQTVVNLTQEKA